MTFAHLSGLSSNVTWPEKTHLITLFKIVILTTASYYSSHRLPCCFPLLHLLLLLLIWLHSFLPPPHQNVKESLSLLFTVVFLPAVTVSSTEYKRGILYEYLLDKWKKKWRQYFQLKNMVNIVSRITLSNKPAANHIWWFKFNLKWLKIAQNTKLSSSVALATFQVFNSHSEIEHIIFVESSTGPHSILENECINHNKRVGVKGKKILTKIIYII